jgi:hypothetical protein
MRELDWEGIFGEAWEAWEAASEGEYLTGMKTGVGRLIETLPALTEESVQYGHGAAREHLYDLMLAARDAPITEDEFNALRFLVIGAALVVSDMLAAKEPVAGVAGFLGYIATTAYQIGYSRRS